MCGVRVGLSLYSPAVGLAPSNQPSSVLIMFSCAARHYLKPADPSVVATLETTKLFWELCRYWAYYLEFSTRKSEVSADALLYVSRALKFWDVEMAVTQVRELRNFIEYCLCYRRMRSINATSAIVSVFTMMIWFRSLAYWTSVEHIYPVLDDRLDFFGKTLVEVLCHMPSVMYAL